jgi:hypothetical protein
MEGIEAERSLGAQQPSEGAETNLSSNESFLHLKVATSNSRSPSRTY